MSSGSSALIPPAEPPRTPSPGFPSPSHTDAVLSHSFPLLNLGAVIRFLLHNIPPILPLKPVTAAHKKPRVPAIQPVPKHQRASKVAPQTEIVDPKIKNQPPDLGTNTQLHLPPQQFSITTCIPRFSNRRLALRYGCLGRAGMMQGPSYKKQIFGQRRVEKHFVVARSPAQLARDKLV